MASSLTLGRFDLLDIDSPVRLDPDWSMGSGPPTVSEIESTVLDGAVVTGRATGNRNPTIPIYIPAGSCPPDTTTASLLNEVLRVVEQPTWPLTYTPDGGLPVTYDCFRATVAYDSTYAEEARGLKRATITCEAMPFGRSQSPQSIALVNSLAVVDDFDTVPAVACSTGAAPSAAVATTPTFNGPHSVQVGYTIRSYTLTRAGLSVAVPASGLTTFTVMAYNSQPGFGGVSAPIIPTTPWQITVTVSGTGAGTYTGTVSTQVPYESWTQVPFTLTTPIPAGGTITGWQVTVPKFGVVSGTGSNSIFFDYLFATSNSGSLVSSTNGAWYTIANVLGSARCPVNLAIARTTGAAFSAFCAHTPPAANPAAQVLLPLNINGSGGYTTAPNVKYNGTYSVWIAGTSTAGASVSVTFSQSSPTGGATKTFTFTAPASLFFIQLGEVALPLAGYPSDSSVTTTVTITAPGAVTTYEVLLLDTRGQTIIAGTDAPAYEGAWIDEPPPGRLLGGVYTGHARSSATSVSAHMPVASTLLFEPGGNTLLLHSVHGPLTATATYTPRWMKDATV